MVRNFCTNLYSWQFCIFKHMQSLTGYQRHSCDNDSIVLGLEDFKCSKRSNKGQLCSWNFPLSFSMLRPHHGYRILYLKLQHPHGGVVVSTNVDCCGFNFEQRKLLCALVSPIDSCSCGHLPQLVKCSPTRLEAFCSYSSDFCFALGCPHTATFRGYHLTCENK